MRIPRRDFLASAAALGAGSLLPANALALSRPSPAAVLYPPIDLSYFDTPITAAPSEIHFGYAAITWGGNDRQAIEDIASLGFPGIQLRSNCIEEFGSPAVVRDLLLQHNLRFVALSSGDIDPEPGAEAEQIALHARRAEFVQKAGGFYLQVTDKRPQGREVTATDCKRLGKLLTTLGRRIADLGVSLGYHNHMGSRGERPSGVEWIMDSVDPRYARLELDIAHYAEGGGNPAEAIEKYADRLLFLHIKDLEHVRDPKEPFRFVELGRGYVNLPGVFNALRKINFRGWAIVELDRVPDQARTPKESAAISKSYLEEKLNVKI
jgi:inosose dehydratase